MLYVLFGHTSPAGSAWIHVDGKLQHVTVSPGGHVWGVNSHGNIYIRYGIVATKKGGSSWQQVSGSLKQISAGKSGVWGVNSQGNIYYRVGTFGDNGAKGTDWKWVRIHQGTRYEDA